MCWFPVPPRRLLGFTPVPGRGRVAAPSHAALQRGKHDPAEEPGRQGSGPSKPSGLYSRVPNAAKSRRRKVGPGGGSLPPRASDRVKRPFIGEMSATQSLLARGSSSTYTAPRFPTPARASNVHVQGRPAESESRAPTSCFPQNLHLGHGALLPARLLGVPRHLWGKGVGVRRDRATGSVARAEPMGGSRPREHLGVTGPSPARLVTRTPGRAVGTWPRVHPLAGRGRHVPSFRSAGCH